MTGRGEAASGLSLPSLSLLHPPPSPIKGIANEEQGEFIEKLFREMQGKKSSSGARGHGMARHGVELTLAVDKWEIVWSAMSLGWAGKQGETHADSMSAL